MLGGVWGGVGGISYSGEGVHQDVKPLPWHAEAGGSHWNVAAYASTTV